MSRVTIGSAAYKITADTAGLTDGVAITRREIGRANRILEQTKPAAQKLEEQMQLLERAFNAGSISADRYNQAMATLAQRKNMLAQQTSQVSQALQQLPLPDVAKQALAAAGNVQQLSAAFKTLMASPQVLAMVAAVTSLVVTYRLLADQIERARKEQEKLAEQQRQVAQAAARSATAGFATQLELIKQSTREDFRLQQSQRLREEIQERTTELARTDIQLKDKLKQLQLDLIKENRAGGAVDEEKIARLKDEIRLAEERLDINEETRRLLREQLAEIERINSEEAKAQKKREEGIRRNNQFDSDRKALQEEIVRLTDIAAGKDAEREKMMRGLNSLGRSMLRDEFDKIDALNAQIEAQQKLEKEREEAARKQKKDIEDAIRDHERMTEEMQKQAEAIKDRLDPAREFQRRIAGIEQMGMQGMLSPDEVAAAIAEAVSDHLRTMERDKQSAQMIEQGTMAHIQFIQKMETEAEKRDKQRLAIEQRQTEILGNIEASNQAQADALAGLGLL